MVREVGVQLGQPGPKVGLLAGLDEEVGAPLHQGHDDRRGRVRGGVRQREERLGPEVPVEEVAEAGLEKGQVVARGELVDVHLAEEEAHGLAVGVRKPGLVLGEAREHGPDARVRVAQDLHHLLDKLLKGQGLGVSVDLAHVLGPGEHIGLHPQDGQREGFSCVVEVLSGARQDRVGIAKEGTEMA